MALGTHRFGFGLGQARAVSTPAAKGEGKATTDAKAATDEEPLNAAESTAVKGVAARGLRPSVNRPDIRSVVEKLARRIAKAFGTILAGQTARIYGLALARGHPRGAEP